MRTGSRWVAVLFLIVSFASLIEAQQPAKAVRLGVLGAVSGNPSSAARFEAFRQALRDLGYTEGKNLVFEYRTTAGEFERLPELANELVRIKVDVIVVAGGLRPIRAAKNATRTIPIVMLGVGADPVAAGIIESLGRPGGNVTGLTTLSRELAGKRLEMFKEAIPRLARVAVLYDPAVRPNVVEAKDVLPVAARALGLTVQPWEIRDAEGFQTVFAALNKQRPDGVYVSAGPLMGANEKRIVDFVLKSRFPSIHSVAELVDAGGFMFYGADYADSHRRGAIYVDKILKGAKPAELPVEQSTKFELAVNLKTARQLDLIIPPHVLARADRVIK